MNTPAGKLAILLWSAAPERPELCAAPFIYATAAGALDCEVEVYFSGSAIRLLAPGVADGLYPGRERRKSLYAFMREAAGEGARFLACSMAMRDHLSPGQPLIPEYGGDAGATAFVRRALDPEWRTLVF